MTAVGAVMLHLDPPFPLIAIAVAGVFTFVSGMIYLSVCIRALRDAQDG